MLNWLVVIAGLVAALHWFGVIDLKAIVKKPQAAPTTQTGKTTISLPADIALSQRKEELQAHITTLQHFVAESESIDDAKDGLQACATLRRMVDGLPLTAAQG